MSKKDYLQKSKNFIEDLTNFGITQINRGVFLETQECLIQQQKNWNNEHLHEGWEDGEDADFIKNDFFFDADLTSYPYWVTTDDGQNPVGIRDAQELAEFLAKNGS